jgi:hypothetical protein
MKRLGGYALGVYAWLGISALAGAVLVPVLISLTRYGWPYLIALAWGLHALWLLFRRDRPKL